MTSLFLTYEDSGFHGKNSWNENENGNKIPQKCQADKPSSVYHRFIPVAAPSTLVAPSPYRLVVPTLRCPIAPSLIQSSPHLAVTSSNQRARCLAVLRLISLKISSPHPTMENSLSLITTRLNHGCSSPCGYWADCSWPFDTIEH
uniref:Uncharacterized protein n=1 Tax=Kalanchoe fedtschenkoi TaxID=63787 RepID=A0A7N0URP4_KALFE